MKQLIGWPMLAAGIILLTVGHHWFHGAHTVGVILVIVSGAALVVGITVVLMTGYIMKRAKELIRK